MTDIPIIFSAPMVKALLSGRKTMTRRIAWRCPCKKGAPPHVHGAGGYAGWKPSPWQKVKPGDRLWVRESISYNAEHNNFYYAADNAGCGNLFYHLANSSKSFKSRPSIHMPRLASRLTLTVTATKIERLNEISETDAIAEGVEPPATERDSHDWSICPKCGGTGLHGTLGRNLGFMEVDCYECDTSGKRFQHLWSHLHGPDSWAANPDVVALTFRVAKDNIDRIAA